MTGLTEDPRFQHLRRLGQGGFGDVYAGLDTVRGVEVAIKKLKLAGPESIYRFKQEFRAVEAIDHPNLVQLHELLQSGGDWVFTMELVQGVDFTRHVRPQGTLDLRRLRDCLRQLAAGLSHLHASGKLHLDVKPANVLVRADGRLKLVDFGLAADFEETREDRTTDRSAGTLEYMAPEQAAGRAHTAAADWYPVGVMIYEALAGHLPFSGGPLKILVDKSRGEAPPLSADARALAPDLAALAERMLLRAPEQRPAGQTICEALGATLAAAPTLTALRTPFVGRAAEVERLEAAWAAARAGTQVIVAVSGTSGIGKSTLVRHFAAMTAESDGALLLTGRCHERESVPFKGVDSLIDALGKTLARLQARGLPPPVVEDLPPLLKLFPVLGRTLVVRKDATPSEAVAHATWRRRAFRALRELLCQLALRQPLMITLDDLQWADYDSAELLEVLFTPPAPVPMLLIAAHRNEERTRSPFLNHLHERLPHETLVLGPLGVAEMRRLVHGIAPMLPDEAAEAILREAGQSPFLAAELARFAETGDHPVVNLVAAVAARTSALTPGARTLLEVLAIAAGPVPLGALSRCLPTDEDLESALRPLQSDRLVWVHGAGEEREAEVAHARLGEAVVSTLGVDARRALHARMAAALSGVAGVAQATVGDHLEASGHASQATPHILRAAEEALEKLAFDRAARLFERASALGATQDAAGGDLRRRIAETLALTGRSAESAELWSTLAAGATGDTALVLRQRAAEQFLRAARLDEGRDALRTLMAALHMRLPETRLGALLEILRNRLKLGLRGLGFEARAPQDVPPDEARRADVAFTVAQCLSPIDLLRGAAMVGRSLREALRTRDPERVARAVAVEAAVQATQGASGRARAALLLDLGRGLTDGRDAPEAACYLRLCEAIAEFQGGTWARSLRAAEEAGEAFRRERPGLVWEQATADAYALGSAWWMGDLARVRDVAPERARDARARGDRYTEAYFVLAVFAVPSILRDAPEQGLVEVEQAHADWHAKHVEFQDFYYQISRIYLRLYAGDAAGALTLADATARAIRWSFVWQVGYTRAVFLDARARAAVATGACGRARADARALRRLGQPWHAALADLIEGAVARREGRADAARDLLRRGADAAERCDMLLYAQAGRHAHGCVVGGPRGEEEAAGALKWAGVRGAANPERLMRLISPG